MLKITKFSNMGTVSGMREYVVKTVKVGDSIVIALPKELLAAEKITENMLVKITVQKGPKVASESKGNNLSCEDDPWRQLE
jgi:hypothetical protein